MASELVFQRILVLRGGALGDFIVTLPALAALRERWPVARIEFVGNARAAELARVRGLIDAVHSQHEARWAALFSAAPLPAEFTAWLRSFDVVINFWPDPDGTVQRHLEATGTQVISASAMPTQAPAAAHYLAALQPLGVQNRELWYALRPLEGATAGSGVPALPQTSARSRSPLPRVGNRPRSGERERADSAESVQRSQPARFAVHPGSGSPRKNLPVERWGELIARLPAPVLLIVGEAEAERCSQTAWGDHVRVLAHPPLETLVTELSACRLFLGHDSGVSHLAAACGVPSILLFGPTDPALWAPPAPHVTVIRGGSELSAISVQEVEAKVGRIVPHPPV